MKVDLDEALRMYVDQPAPLGMEARILQRVRKRRIWVWPAAGLVAACCAMSVWMAPAFLPPPIPPPAFHNRFLPAAVLDLPRQIHGTLHLQFEANALWRFVQEHPEVALEIASAREPDPVALLQFEPIAFQPLQFEPISIEELGDK